LNKTNSAFKGRVTNKYLYSYKIHLINNNILTQQIAQISLVVNDYDETIAFYTQKLQFVLIEDTKLTETKRWVRIAPKGIVEPCILLAQASNDEQRSRIGNQTGGRVFLFLYTDDFDRDFQHLKDQGVKIVREPSNEKYGRVLVFEDLYGNLWDLIEPAQPI
jgi:catechol 2,3-dioxygenase-like lactoylglutathione lyase family enzyme